MSQAEGGPLTMLVQAYVGHVGQWDQLDPVERNLRRVSHGTAYLAAIAALVSGHWPALDAGLASIDSLSYGELGRNIVTGWLGAAGLIRIYTGLRAFRYFNPTYYENTAALRVRALCGIAIGIAGLVWLGRVHDAWIGAGLWWGFAWDGFQLLAGLNLLTSCVRLLLLRPRRAVPFPGPVEDEIRADEWRWRQ